MKKQALITNGGLEQLVNSSPFQGGISGSSPESATFWAWHWQLILINNKRNMQTRGL